MVAVELSKIVVVTINVIFLIFGLAALIVGIIFKVGWDDVRDAFIDIADEVNFDLQSAGDVLGYGGIIFGAFIIVVSLLGCIGACCKLRVLLVLYAIILLILIIGECAIVGIVATHADETEVTIETAMNKSLNGYNENSDGDISRGYSGLFNKLECCGIRNFTLNFPIDPNNSSHNLGFNPSSRRTGTSAAKVIIPITCCKNFDYKSALDDDTFKNHDKCLLNIEPDSTYTEGCLTKIIDLIKDNKGILIGVGVAILVLELLMVFLALYLCCSRDNKGVHA